MTTLKELLQPRDESTIESILVAVLQQATIEGMPGVRFPTSDWNEGSFERTHMRLIATGVLDREDLVKYIAAGGFLQYATTLADVNGNLSALTTASMAPFCRRSGSGGVLEKMI